MRNKGYNNYYKKPETPVNEKKIEEVQNTEETAEVVQEETPIEEEKVEEAPTEEAIERDFEQEVGKTYAIVAGAKKVNMRENPNKEAKVLTVLSIGTKVELIDEIGNWAEIKYNDEDGFMMKQFLKHVAN